MSRADRPHTNELYELLSATICRELLSLEKQIKVPGGAKLVGYGVPPENVIIIKQGTAQVSVQTGQKEVRLALAGRGKVLGLHTLVSGTWPGIEVRSQEPCTLGLIPLQEFKRVLKRYPEIYRAISRILTADLKTAENVLR